MILEKELFSQFIKAGIAKDSAKSFIIRLLQIVLMLIATIYMAKLLPSEEFGAYSFAIAWIAIISRFTSLGFPHSLVRYVAQTNSRNEFIKGKSFLITAIFFTIIVSVVCVIFIYFMQNFIFPSDEPKLKHAALLGLLIVPIVSLTQVLQGAIRGLYFVVRSQISEFLVQPLFFLLFVIILSFLTNTYLHGSHIIFALALATLIALINCVISFYKVLPKEFIEAESNLNFKFFKISFPFFIILISATISAQFDIIIVGYLLGASETGIYAFAKKISNLSSFALLAISMPLSPAIARNYAEKDSEDLQRNLSISAVVGGISTIALVVGLITITPFFLSWIGKEYSGGYLAMCILCIGKIFESLIGPAGTVLAMTSYARIAAFCIFIGAITTIILNIVFIKLWGIEGAAFGTTIALITQMILMALFVHKKLNLSTHFLKGATFIKSIYKQSH
jgi:O-antigen/teichoic acid export membrane protein